MLKLQPAGIIVLCRHLQEEIQPDELNLTLFTFLHQKHTFWYNFSALP